MKLHLYLIIIAAATSSNSFCQHNNQSVIAIAGDISKAGNITLEWTLGEPAIETVSTTVGLLTQGFHQPLLVLPPTFIEIVPRPTIPNFTIKVNPNPVQAVLHVSLRSFNDRKVNINLSDANGKALYNTSANIRSSYISIDMQKYPSGIYLLYITSPINNIVYSYKIVKTP
jgi:hypothetical protein